MSLCSVLLHQTLSEPKILHNIMPQYVIQLSFVYHLSQALLWPPYRSATLYSKHYIRYNTQKQSIVCTKSRVSYSCLTNVINLLGICIYIDGVCYISEWSKLYIWATATHPEDACHIYCRMFISGRWRLHIWTSFTYLDDECYIMDDIYISGLLQRRHIARATSPDLRW